MGFLERVSTYIVLISTYIKRNKSAITLTTAFVGKCISFAYPYTLYLSTPVCFSKEWFLYFNWP